MGENDQVGLGFIEAIVIGSARALITSLQYDLGSILKIGRIQQTSLQQFVVIGSGNYGPIHRNFILSSKGSPHLFKRQESDPAYSDSPAKKP
jgi:hypothetical protein